MLLSRAPEGAETRGDPTLVGALAVAELLSWGIAYYAFAVFAAPFATAIGESRAEVEAAFSVALVGAALAAPIVGRASARFSAGTVLAVGGLVVASGLALLAGASSLVAFHLAWFVVGVGHACTSYEPAFAVVVGRFVDPSRRRNAWLWITSVGGFASAAVVPATATLVVTFGPRPAALGLSAVALLVVTPLYLLVARRERKAGGPPIVAEPGDRSTRPAAIAPIAALFAVQAFVSTVVAAFAFPMLVDRGHDPTSAAGLIALVGASQVPARLTYRFFHGRVAPRARLFVIFVVQAIAIVGIAVASGPVLVAALVAAGATNGVLTLERAEVVVDRFGAAGVAAANGTIASVSLFVRAIAPASVAFVAAGAGYPVAFVACSVGLVFAATAHDAITRAYDSRPGAANESPRAREAPCR